MASRRTFLKAGLTASAAGVLFRPIFGETAAAPYYKAIFDERFEEARAFAAGAAERRIATAAIRGDITRLFVDDLDLRWKQGPVLLAGYTLPASLFCLDLLARDRGMRVTCRIANPGAEAALRILNGTAAQRMNSDPTAQIFWMIEPNVRA